MAPDVIVTGDGAAGLVGLSRAARRLADMRLGGLDLTMLRLLVATSSDAVFFITFVAVGAAVAGRQLLRYWTAAPRIRWRLLMAGVVLAMIALVPVVAAERYMLSSNEALPVVAISKNFWARLIYVVAALLLIPAAAAEELFFRGWLLRQLAAFSRRPSIIIGVSALIFSALHMDFTADGFITRVLMGAGLAYMTLRLGGIEFAAGVHAANNILIVIFVQPLLLEPSTPEVGLTFGSLVEDSVLIGGYLAITEVVARSGVLRRWLRVASDEISEGAVLPAPMG